MGNRHQYLALIWIVDPVIPCVNSPDGFVILIYFIEAGLREILAYNIKFPCRSSERPDSEHEYAMYHHLSRYSTSLNNRPMKILRIE